MSNRTLIFAILLALGLGIVTLLVLQKPPAAQSEGFVPAGERLLELDPAKVRSILISAPGPAGVGQPAITTQCDLETGASSAVRAWRMTIPEMKSEAGKVRPSWRVDGTRVNALLGVLSTITAVGKPEAGAALGDGPTVVKLTLDGGGEVALKLSPRTLGGQGLIEVTSPPECVPRGPGAQPVGGDGKAVTRRALASASLHSLFQGEGPRDWRDRAALPGVLSDASRVRLMAGAGGGLAMAKVSNRWALTEPLAAPADPAAVQRLLTALETLRITRFFDERLADASKTGLDAPIARIIVESDASGGVARRELIVGAPIDAQNKNLYATLDGGETLIGLDAAPLTTQIDIEPAAYLSRVSTGVASPDIGLLMFVAEQPAPVAATPGEPAPPPAPPVPNMGFLRRIDGWVELRPDGGQVLQDPKRTEAINAFLKFITSDPASAVSLSPPSGYQAVGTLSISSAGAQPLDELQIGRWAAVGVAIKAGKVYRTYGSVPELLRAALGPIEPNTGAGPEGKETKDIAK